MSGVRTVLLVLLVAAGSACADNDLTVIILHNQAPQEGCLVTGDQDAPALPFGTLDLAGGQPYVFTPVVRSSALENPDDINDNVVFLRGADVELLAAPTQRSIDVITMLGPAETVRTHLFSANVEPGGSSGVIFILIDQQQVGNLANIIGPEESVQLVARLSVFGEIDGADVTSPEFDYPITVCEGCLVRTVYPDCASLPDGATIAPGGVCNAFQDGIVDCCVSGGVTQCPASI